MLYKRIGRHIADEHLRLGVSVHDPGVWGWGGDAVKSFACVKPT